MKLLLLNRLFLLMLQLSVSGFLFGSVYLIFRHFLYQRTSARFLVRLHLLALGSFLIPFSLIASIYDGTEQYFFAQYQDVVLDGANFFDSAVAFLLRNDDFFPFCDKIWFLGMVLFLLLRLKQYVSSSLFLLEDERWQSIFEAQKEAFGLSHLSLMASHGIGTPFTTGVRHKILVIPSFLLPLFDEQEITWILQHECYHAKQNDVAKKLLLLFCQSFHWMNPMFYYLKETLSGYLELACDEAVTATLTKSQKRAYASLLIRSLELEKQAQSQNSYCLCYGEKQVTQLQQRIQAILQDKPCPHKKVIVALSVAAVFLFFCGNVAAKTAASPIFKLFSQNTSIIDTETTDLIMIPRTKEVLYHIELE